MTPTKYIDLNRLVAAAQVRKLNRHERRSAEKLCGMAIRHEAKGAAVRASRRAVRAPKGQG